MVAGDFNVFAVMTGKTVWTMYRMNVFYAYSFYVPLILVVDSNETTGKKNCAEINHVQHIEPAIKHALSVIITSSAFMHVNAWWWCVVECKWEKIAEYSSHSSRPMWAAASLFIFFLFCSCREDIYCVKRHPFYAEQTFIGDRVNHSEEQIIMCSDVCEMGW